MLRPAYNFNCADSPATSRHAATQKHTTKQRTCWIPTMSLPLPLLLGGASSTYASSSGAALQGDFLHGV